MKRLSRAGTWAMTMAAPFIPPLASTNAQPAVPPGTVLLDPRGVADGQWHWVSVEADRAGRDGWVITSGIGALKMDGRHFHADLKLAPDEDGADLSLDGDMAGNHIRAKEILLNTDAGPAIVSGILHRTVFGNAVETRIAFHGGQSGDASFLGIYRIVVKNPVDR